MVIYSNTLHGLENQLRTDGLNTINRIVESIKEKTGQFVSAGEYYSYATTLNYVVSELKKLLNVDVNVFVEYCIPWTRKRIDLVILGKKNNKPIAFIMELKGWSEAKVTIDGRIIPNTNYTIDEHPSAQAKGYVNLLSNQSNLLENISISLKPVLLMPNYDKKNKYELMKNKIFEYENQDVMFFNSENFIDIGDYINGLITEKLSDDELSNFFNIKRRPNKGLLSIENINELILTESQKRVFNRVMKAIENRKIGEKKAILIKGAPGSGKTVVAINILKAAAEMNKIVDVIAPGQEFRNSLSKKWANVNWKDNIIGLDITEEFHYKKEWDALVVDEGHKVTKMGETIYNFLDKFFRNNDLLISFIDEYQVIRRDGATISDYTEFFEGNNKSNSDKKFSGTVEYEILDLTESFRNGGDITYPDWVRSWLYNEEINMNEFRYNQREFIMNSFNVNVFDDVNVFVSDYDEQYHKINTRMLTLWFYQPTPMDETMVDNNGDAIREVKIGNKLFAWNINKEFVRRAKNKSSFSKELINMSKISFCDPTIKKASWMIGYYHNVQGAEFDTVYVLIPKFVKWNITKNEIEIDVEEMLNDEWYIKNNGFYTLNKKMKKDEYTWRLNENIKFIKNRLYILLTRGTKGTNIYCENKDLNEYLKKCVRKPIN